MLPGRDFGRPVGFLRGLGADTFPLFQAVVTPNVNNLVQRPNLGVPEGRDGRILLPVGQSLGKGFLSLGHGSGFHVVGAYFVNHNPLRGLAARHSLTFNSPAFNGWNTSSVTARPDRATGDEPAPVPFQSPCDLRSLRPPLMVSLSNHRRPSFDWLRTSGWLISTTLKRP